MMTVLFWGFGEQHLDVPSVGVRGGLPFDPLAPFDGRGDTTSLRDCFKEIGNCIKN